MTLDANQSIMNIIGGQYLERWPDDEYRDIMYSSVFTYSQRLNSLTFLYGNFRDAALVYNALRIQIGADSEDHDHALRFLADLKSGKYNEKYYYFDVLAADWFYCTAWSPPSANRPARSRVRCMHGTANVCACIAARSVGRRWQSSANSSILRAQ